MALRLGYSNFPKRKNAFLMNTDSKRRMVAHDRTVIDCRNGSYCVESCKLIKISSQKDFSCAICLTKHVNTACKTCDVTCCLYCYNSHCRSKLIDGIRSFLCNISDETEIFVDEHGALFVKKSISSIRAQWCKTDLERQLEAVKNHFGSTVDLFFDFHLGLQCIYIQEKQGINFYNCYPEFVAIHQVGEIVHLEMTLYVLITADANSHCEVCCSFLLSEENEATVAWMCERIKRYNAKWNEMEILLLDTKIENTDTFQNNFPSCKILMSSLHALNGFKADLLNFDIERKEIKNAAKLFKTLLYATNETQYEKQYQEFCCSFPDLKTYFDNVWYKCQKMWVLRLKFKSSVFFNPIEKFLDKTGKEIITSISALHELEEVIITFFEILIGLRREHFLKISTVFQTAEVISHMKCPQQKYAKLLTCYGGKLVNEQLALAADVRKLKKLGYGKFEITNASISVTVSHCSCNFYTHLTLPCCHIFAARKSISLPLFCKNLCSSRWLSTTYQTFFQFFHAHTISQFNSVFTGIQPCSQFRNWFELLGCLHDELSSAACDSLFQRRIVIASLLEAWRYNISIKVCHDNSACFMVLHSNSENILESGHSVDDLVDMYQIILSSGDEASEEFMSISSCSEVSSMSGF